MGRCVARGLRVAVAVASLALASGARAQVDASGPWGVRADVLGFDIGTFHQTGTSLSATIWGQHWAGTIDSASGGFTLNGPTSPEAPGCPGMQLVASVNPGGVSFQGGVTLWFVGLFGECAFAEDAPVIGRRCGNGVLDPGEQCDDGNFADGDCCPSTCMFATCKQPVKSEASRLTISNRTPDTKDRLSWKWNKGAATTIDELGDPAAGSNGYTLCVFDVSPAGSPGPLLLAQAPAGGGWTPNPKGFHYRSLNGAPNGLRSVTLAAGTDGKAKVRVNGEGDLLPLPASAAPLPLPLLVQLHSDAGGCWEATFSTATSNDGTTFRAKSN
jgi:cysteine-rich repeat protein